MGNGGIIGVKNTGTSGIWTMEDVMLDVNGIRTTQMPLVGSYEKASVIIGVQDTGTRSTDGAGLVQVAYDAEAIAQTTLDTAYFDEHPAYQFDEYIYGGNYFRKIPITYWWRGELPDVSDGTTPRWTMLMSTKPGTVTIHGVDCKFKANPGAFKRNDKWMDQFYFGTYRAYNNGGAPGSVAGQTHWGGFTSGAFKAAAEGMGDGHHMISIYEWHEILARMVIERSTFQVVADADRSNADLCQYRGIKAFAYAGSVFCEMMDGIQTNASSVVMLAEEAGGSLESTGLSLGNNNYIKEIHSGGGTDFLFLGRTVAASGFFIPEYSNSAANSIFYAQFYGAAANGAFSCYLNQPSTYSAGSVGSRLCKW